MSTYSKHLGKSYKLVEGKLYTIYEFGLNEWLDDYSYIGFNSLNDEHIFRSTEQFNNNIFIFVDDKNISRCVLEFNIIAQRDKKLKDIGI